MNYNKYNEIHDKISDISNSEFPLIDFFNDIIRINDNNFNKEQAYKDIEKIYNIIKFYMDNYHKKHFMIYYNGNFDDTLKNLRNKESKNKFKTITEIFNYLIRFHNYNFEIKNLNIKYYTYDNRIKRDVYLITTDKYKSDKNFKKYNSPQAISFLIELKENE